MDLGQSEGVNCWRKINKANLFTMKHICRNCHFFAKETRDPGLGSPFTNVVSIAERKTLQSGEIDFVKPYYNIQCHMGVWDEGLKPGKEDRLERLNKTNRKDKCFFFPFDPSMMFKAAIELQKRAQENRQLKQSNMYTRIGLWIAASALLLNALIKLIF